MRHQAVQQPQRDTRVTRMKQATLPFDDHHVVVLVGADQLLGRPGDEIRDYPIDRDPAASDQDSGLARGGKGGVDPGPFQAFGQLDGHEHLTATAIVGHRMDPQTTFTKRPPAGHVTLLVVAQIDQLDPLLGRRPGELGIVLQ